MDASDDHVGRRVFLATVATGSLAGCLRLAGDAGESSGTSQTTAAGTPGAETPAGDGTSGSTPTDSGPTPAPGTPEQGPQNVDTDPLSVPFTASFDGGLNGWIVNTRYRTGDEMEPGAGEFPQSQLSQGDGGYSEKHGGSVRLHVNGGPSAVGVARTADGLTKGTTVRAGWESSNFQPDRGKVALLAFPPGEGNANQAHLARSKEPGTPLSATLSQDYPDGTELRFVADVWPGEYTVYVTEISAGGG